MKLAQIPIGLIDPPPQPHRLAMDEQKLRELAESMRAVGLLNPILVRPTAGGRYEIVAGHRRYTAATTLGWVEIAAIETGGGDADAEAARFAENLQRADLTPMEEAVAVTRLAEQSAMPDAEIAQRLARSPTWVRTRLQLMLLPEPLADLVHAGTLSVGAALQLARVTDAQHQQFLTRYATEGGASTAVIRAWVDEWVAAAEAGRADDAPKPDWDPQVGRVVVMMPCYLCAQQSDHVTLRILRVCHACAHDIATARSAPADKNQTT